MLTDLYVFGDSRLHRASPALKIGGLAVLCTSLFVVEGWPSTAAAGVLVLLGYWLAGLSFRHVWISMRPAFWILAAIFAVQVYQSGWSMGGFVVARLAVLILAASLVTLTTKTSEFIDGIVSALKYAPSWIPKERIALSIALCLRFIPMIRQIFEEVRQAQRARGLDRSVKALIVPLIVRALKKSDDIANAIYSRSFR